MAKRPSLQREEGLRHPLRGLLRLGRDCGLPYRNRYKHLPPSLVESDEEEILSNACFISEIAGRVHRGELAAAILRCFFELLRSIEADDGRELLSLYKDSCSTLGREVRVVSDDGVVTGRAIRIGENGELVVKTRDREFAFCAADVIHATPNE